MRRFWHFILLAVTGLALMVLSPPILSQAKEITNVTGLDADSAVITDPSGKVMSHTADLSSQIEYRVDYKWTLPDSTRVKQGDTMTVQLPSNIYNPNDIDVALKSSSGAVVGRLTLAEGSYTATITLNNYLATHNINKRGWVWFKFPGKVEPNQPEPTPEPTPAGPITMAKTAAWSSPDDYSKINWQLIVSSNDNKLVNPRITDTLNAGQTYVARSVRATTATGKTIPVLASANRQQITFRLTVTTTQNIHITYQTATNDSSNQAMTFDNVAVYTDSNNNNADATAQIDKPATEEPETPTEPETPEEPEPNKEPITMSKTAAWSDPKDPSTINWGLHVTSNGNQLVNPVITDVLGDDQLYWVGSAKATDAAGQSIPVTVTTDKEADGQTVLLFKLRGTFNSDLDLTYQTLISKPTPGKVYQNKATYTDDNNNNADASANIEAPEDDTSPSEPEPEPTAPIKMTKTASWSDPNDKSKITWNLAITNNGNKLVNPTITDTLSDNHTYIPGSVSATAEQIPVPITATVNGNQVVFKINKTIDSNLNITYETQVKPSSITEIYRNNAVYQDENGNNAEATDNIILTPDETEDDEEDTGEPGTEEPGTEEPGTEEPGTEEPGTEEPGTETPGTEEPGTETPGTETPGTEEPGTEEPGTETPGTETPGTEEPGTEEPGTETPGTETPGTEEPEKPGTQEPEKPTPEEPEKPGTQEPEKPGTQEPEKPTPEEPEKPGTQEPEKPIENDEQPTTPTTPGTTTPVKPTTPGTSTTTTNPYPSESTPMKPNLTGHAMTSAPVAQPTYQPQTGSTTSPNTPATTTTANTPTTATTPANTLTTPAAAATMGTPSASPETSATLPQTNERQHQHSALIGLLAMLGLLLIAIASHWLTHRSQKI